MPFVVWCSDEYIEKHAEILELLNHSADKPYMIDKLCHLLFHIGGIETAYYKKDKDILDSSYQVGRRIVNAVNDYDKIMNNAHK